MKPSPFFTTSIERCPIMNPILLSISMLISGREDMQKSLESLMFFKNAFPTEIILVDTGCNKEQRKLAEKYADKIVSFTWCNDFAKARNAGIREVHGEWFMYLDDDEWFDHPQEIISFFTSGEYKEYNSATYLVRSYTNREGTLYEDGQVSRMVRMEKDTCFQGKIHEYLSPFKLPQKSFTDYAHHYGYVFQNEEERQKHSRRNISPLLEMVEENPGNIRWLVQLAQEYFGINELDKTIEICQKGIEFWNTHRIESIPFPPEIGCAYAFILAANERKLDFLSAGKWLNRALNESNVPEVIKAYFYMSGIRIFGKANEHDKCSYYTEKYLKYYFKLKDNIMLISQDTFLLTENVFQKQLAFPSLMIGIPSLIYERKYELAKKAFFTIDWEDPRMLHQMQYEQKIVEACCSVPYNFLWHEILQTLVSRKEGMKEMYPVFLEQELAYKKEGQTEQLTRLRHLVSQLDYPHRYVLYTKILWEDQNAENQESQVVIQKLNALFEELFQEYSKELFEIKEEVWNVADKWHIDLESPLLKVRFVIWRRCLDSWTLKAKPEEINVWTKRVQEWQLHEDIRYDLFAIKCTEGYLRNVEPLGYSMEQVESLLWEYADKVLNLYQPLLNVDGMSEASADEIKMASRIQDLKQARNNETDQEVLNALRRLKDTYEALNGTMAYYAKLYKEEVHNRNNEMEELAAKLKQKVKILIHTGKFDDAEAVIKQLEQYWPGDAELAELKNKLQMD